MPEHSETQSNEAQACRPAGLPEDAVCLRCKYPLKGLPEQVCPECGRWFDSTDPTTYRAFMNPDWRRWARPPSAREYLLLSGLTLYGLMGASGPLRWEGGAFFCLVMVLGAPLWLGLLGFWIVRLITCRRDAERAHRDRASGPRRHVVRWAIAPFCGVLVVTTWLYPWPLMLRFGLSRPAFEAAVGQYQAGTFTAPRRVGLYYVQAISSCHGNSQTVCFETGYSLIDPVGFEYDPNPNHAIGFMVLRVAPCWYTYEED